MLDFMMNDKVYENQANDQLSVILSQFDSGYVMDVVEDTLNNNMNSFSTIPRPNAVLSFETIYKELYNTYPFDIDNVNQSRIETYTTIIDFICKKFDIMFTQPDDIDIYTIAFYMYDFFVSKLDLYLVKFYANHIINEKEDIYTSMNLEGLGSNKDISSIYSQMQFDDDKELAVIAANLPMVLKELSASTQVPDYVIYRSIYGDMPDVLPVFEECILCKIPVFTIYNRILFNPDLYGSVITEIRIALQKSINMDRVNL